MRRLRWVPTRVVATGIVRFVEGGRFCGGFPIVGRHLVPVGWKVGCLPSMRQRSLWRLARFQHLYNFAPSLWYSRTMKRPQAADVATTDFDRLFRATARRLLRRRGMPEEKIEAEITRLRRTTPKISLDRLEEVLKGN